MTINDAFLHWHNYRYFPYEKTLGLREVTSLFGPCKIQETENGLKVHGNIDKTDLGKLVYFSGYSLNGNGSRCNTFQHAIETSCSITGKQRRQTTRYSVHGLHEYKGKFNPQIVRGILNILEVNAGSKMIDPFCGSGTTLVECSYGDVRAVGSDMNPLAVLISNAKLKALSVPVERLRELAHQLLEAISSNRNTQPVLEDSARTRYLRHWFNDDILYDLEYLRYSIMASAGEFQNIFLVLASDLLRDYSLQEPADLRIRRRRTPLPEVQLCQAFKQKICAFLENLESAQKVTDIVKNSNRAYLQNCRSFDYSPCTWNHKPAYDAAITSPPYATALPYIDTQRLSLIWLNLIQHNELRLLEANLTGSRELANGQKKMLQNILVNNEHKLAYSVYDFCMNLKKAVSEKDGFRRQSVPFLMYRYFSDMQKMLRNILSIVRRRAPFALVVGHNQTTLGGNKFDVDTPNLLKNIAVDCGWHYDESIPLQTYHRYSIHQRNAVKTETLLILRKP